jgi:hypothetical protein
MRNSFQTGELNINSVMVPVVSTILSLEDHIGAMRVRWGISRDNYRVIPGLYAAGNPGSESDVLVTANYKLSFDSLRRNLTGMNVWILVLDTKGVNVWCAAGKGTFGTGELVRKIKEVSLGKIVSHKRIIVPQLGATGVAAHKVKEETGFRVLFGPVRASDIRKFITAGYKADREMRKVSFTFLERVKLIPNDFMYGKYYLLGALSVILIIFSISREGFSPKHILQSGTYGMLNIFLAYLSGIVITPVLLPYIPARPFSLKGFYTGVILFLLLFLTGRTGKNIFETGSWFLIIAAISSFVAMNFTGSSTFTSLSGVKKEMKISLPLQIAFAFFGIILLIIGKLS